LKEGREDMNCVADKNVEGVKELVWTEREIRVILMVGHFTMP